MEETTKFEGQIRKGGWAAAAQIAEQFFRNNGLIGVNSGTVTQRFNQYFQAATPNGFGKPSELVFDTNVYACTVEFAMPAIFLKIPRTFADKVVRLETKVKYKMQELASAYYKIFKYNNTFFSRVEDFSSK